MAIRLYGELMRNHTTFRLGGPADELCIPESREELIQEINACRKSGHSCRVMGNGSNILVRDQGIRGVVVKNTKALDCLEKSGNRVIAGSSVMLPQFVHFCVDHDLEGMEYLSSIPGTVGGALFMNAGRGRKDRMAISDKLEWVTVYDGRKELRLDRSELNFAFRKSSFQQRRDWLILEACFLLQHQDKEVGREEIRKRLDFVNRTQNRKFPSAGSIYDEYSKRTLRIMRGIRIGGCRFEGNWILNIDQGRARDVLRLLMISRILHFFFLKRPVLEIEIW